jgi:hypothetical protein
MRAVGRRQYPCYFERQAQGINYITFIFCKLCLVWYANRGHVFFQSKPSRLVPSSSPGVGSSSNIMTDPSSESGQNHAFPCECMECLALWARFRCYLSARDENYHHAFPSNCQVCASALQKFALQEPSTADLFDHLSAVAFIL